MSDEQREPVRDEGPDAPRTDQHPVPSYAGAPAAGPEHEAPATATAQQPAFGQTAPPPRSPYTGAPWPPYGQPTSQNPYFPPRPAPPTARRCWRSPASREGVRASS